VGPIGAYPAAQLEALASVREAFDLHGIAYWLFGGWAVDFHVGRVTRSHDDIDLAVWLSDREDVGAVLEAAGWRHVPEVGEAGYTVYECDGVRLEVAFLERGEADDVFTPLTDGRAPWPIGSFGDDLASLERVSEVRVVSLQSLKTDKGEARDDPRVAAKDRSDRATLEAECAPVDAVDLEGQ
jgi:Aminoglycoside-2''-adenylyltransferase